MGHWHESVWLRSPTSSISVCLCLEIFVGRTLLKDMRGYWHIELSGAQWLTGLLSFSEQPIVKSLDKKWLFKTKSHSGPQTTFTGQERSRAGFQVKYRSPYPQHLQLRQRMQTDDYLKRQSPGPGRTIYSENTLRQQDGNLTKEHPSIPS